MLTCADTKIALHTFFWIISNTSIACDGQCTCWAFFHAGSATNTHPSCFRIVAIFAINIAALKKDCGTVSWTIHAAKWNDIIYKRFHYLTFLSNTLQLLAAPRASSVVSCNTALPALNFSISERFARYPVTRITSASLP